MRTSVLRSLTTVFKYAKKCGLAHAIGALNQQYLASLALLNDIPAKFHFYLTINKERGVQIHCSAFLFGENRLESKPVNVGCFTKTTIQKPLALHEQHRYCS